METNKDNRKHSQERKPVRKLAGGVIGVDCLDLLWGGRIWWLALFEKSNGGVHAHRKRSKLFRVGGSETETAGEPTVCISCVITYGFLAVYCSDVTTCGFPRVFSLIKMVFKTASKRVRLQNRFIEREKRARV